jgi:hypothetical protein
MGRQRRLAWAGAPADPSNADERQADAANGRMIARARNAIANQPQPCVLCPSATSAIDPAPRPPPSSAPSALYSLSVPRFLRAPGTRKWISIVPRR